MPLFCTTAAIGYRLWDIGNGIFSPDIRYPIADIRLPIRELRARAFSRFLASYSALFFSRESTVVHTAFQRVLTITSR